MAAALKIMCSIQSRRSTMCAKRQGGSTGVSLMSVKGQREKSRKNKNILQGDTNKRGSPRAYDQGLGGTGRERPRRTHRAIGLHHTDESWIRYRLGEKKKTCTK